MLFIIPVVLFFPRTKAEWPLWPLSFTMGETLGIAHNVFEKVAREKDRKERLKKYEEWQRVKLKRQQRIKDMRTRIGPNGSVASMADPEDLDDPIMGEDFDLTFDSPYKSSKSLAVGPLQSGTPQRSPQRMTCKKLSLQNFKAHSLASLDHSDVKNGNSNHQEVKKDLSSLKSSKISLLKKNNSSQEVLNSNSKAKAQDIVVRHQPCSSSRGFQSLRSPSLPQPLQTTSTASLSALSKTSASDFPLDESSQNFEKNGRHCGKCSIL